MNKESFVYVVIFTFIIAFLFVFIIALTDNVTKDIVARNQKLVIAQSYLKVIGKAQDDDAKNLENFSRIFGSVKADEVIKADIDGQQVLVKQFSGKGLWGTITGVLATDINVQRILGLDIISHAETPGLGGRIEEDWFKDQFKNEKISSDGLMVRKGEGRSDSDPDNSIVDGVTGASLTSASIQVIVNDEISKIREAVK